LYKSLKDTKFKNHSDMFRILCDASSGSTELRLTEITVVCVYGTAGCTVHTHTHTHTHHIIKITLPHTDQAHDKISVNHYKQFQSSAALYSLMMDHIRSETCRSDF
jgi:hypothetical protein